MCRSRGGSPGEASEEAPLAALAAAALRVVAAVVTHAAAPPSRCQPQAAAEVAAAGVAAALAPWDQTDTQRQTFERPSSANERKAADSSAQMSFWRAAAAPCVLPLDPPATIAHSGTGAASRRCRWQPATAGRCRGAQRGGVVPAHTLAGDLPFQSTDRKHRFKNILGLFFYLLRSRKED